jgi:uncharacterized membrane protein YbaN (DUF454 family)
MPRTDGADRGRTARFGDRAKRKLFVALGLACLAFGVVGVIVPGLPGTIFLLAASYLFVRSSPRLDRWLREHPRLGPYLRLAQRGAMTRRAKVASLLAMWTGIFVSLQYTGAGTPAGRLTLIGLGLIGTGVILFRIRTSPAVER